MKHIKDLLNTSIKQAGITELVEDALILKEVEHALKELFGDEILTHAKPISVDNKVVTIAVLSSVVSAELMLRRYDMIHQINKRFPNTLNTIKCMV